MSRALIALALLFSLFLPCWLPAPALAASHELREGDLAPDYLFPLPQKKADLKYLGLKPGAEGFTMKELKADVLILEFFNMYCRHCRHEAPNVNRLQALILQKKLGQRIKMLGVGAYNSQFEVDLFKKRYKVAFPLLPDKKLKAFKAFSAEGTPHFVVMDLKRGPKVIMIVSGPLPEPPDVLQEIRAKSKPGGE